MTIGQILLAMFLGLVVNECCDVSPWLARKLVRWSAHRRYASPARAELRAEELAKLIDDRPGRLFKLITALGFVATAVVTRKTAPGDAQPNPLRQPITLMSKRQVAYWLMIGFPISIIGTWLSIQSIFGILAPSDLLSFIVTVVVGVSLTAIAVMAPVVRASTTAPTWRLPWFVILLINIGTSILGTIWYGVMKNPLDSRIVLSEIRYDPGNWLETGTFLAFVLIVAGCCYRYGQALSFAARYRYDRKRPNSSPLALQVGGEVVLSESRVDRSAGGHDSGEGSPGAAEKNRVPDE